jgi:hypothetical protein
MYMESPAISANAAPLKGVLDARFDGQEAGVESTGQLRFQSLR